MAKDIKKNVVKATKQAVVAEIDEDLCPMTWLRKFYDEDEGKFVVMDDEKFLYLLNRSKRDEVNVETVETANGYKTKIYTLIWHPREGEYPATMVKIISHGPEEEVFEEGKYKILGASNANWHVICEIESEGFILRDGRSYGENATTDPQFIFLAETKNDLDPEV